MITAPPGNYYLRIVRIGFGSGEIPAPIRSGIADTIPAVLNASSIYALRGARFKMPRTRADNA